MKAEALSPSESTISAVVTRCPTSKYLKPGADPVEDLGVISHSYKSKSLLKRVLEIVR